MISSKKLALYIMSEKGFSVLNSIVSSGHKELIGKVIIGTDKNVINDYSEEIRNICVKNNLEFYKRQQNIEITEEYSLAVSWRWIINSGNSQLIVLHDSLLPKYRGFAPLVNSLINKEPQIGVTAIFANDDFDTGDIIGQVAIDVEYPLKIKKAIEMIISGYNELVLDIIKRIHQNVQIHGVQQDEREASYSLWRDEQDYFIDWNSHAGDIMNFINAVSYPYLGASSFINGSSKVRILNSEVYKEEIEIVNKKDVGKVLFLTEGNPVVVCKNSLLKLTSVVTDNDKTELIPLKNTRVRFSKETY